MTADAGKTPAFKGRVGKTEKTIGYLVFLFVAVLLKACFISI